MDKLAISDPSINLVPSKVLREFIGALELSPSTPAAIRYIHTAFNTSRGKRAAKTTLQKDGSVSDLQFTVDFTGKECSWIEQYITEGRSALDADCIGLVSNEEQTTSGSRLRLNDVKWLYSTLSQMRQTDPSIPYLHTLLRGCQLELPKNPIQERNEELEIRCQRLRKEQEDREYQIMTKNVDSVRKHMPEDTIAYQIKQINRHLIAVAQFIFSVAAGFAFGFIGIELIVGQLDFGFRLLLGIIIALVIALAEIYFLAKKLNEEYEVPLPSTLGSKGTLSSVIKTLPANGTSEGKEHYE